MNQRSLGMLEVQVIFCYPREKASKSHFGCIDRFRHYDITTVPHSFTVCSHPVLSINSTIKSCCLSHVFNFSSQTVVTLWHDPEQKWSEAVSGDSVKPIKHAALHFSGALVPLFPMNDRQTEKTPQPLWEPESSLTMSVAASRKRSTPIFCFSCWFCACV